MFFRVGEELGGKSGQKLHSCSDGGFDSVDISSSFSFFLTFFICLLAQQQHFLLNHTEYYIKASQSQIEQSETVGLQMLDSFFTSSCTLGGMKVVCLFLLLKKIKKLIYRTLIHWWDSFQNLALN